MMTDTASKMHIAIAALWEEGPASLARKVETAVSARVTELEDALRLCDRYCEHLDHAPGKRFHKAGEPCPVEKIVNDALDMNGER